MAYLYKDIATTQKGSIKYPRKKHLFKSKDLHRVLKKVGYPTTDEELLNWIPVMLDALNLLERVPDQMVSDRAALTWQALKSFERDNSGSTGGGGFTYGGGGAGGTFWKPFPTSGILENKE